MLRLPSTLFADSDLVDETREDIKKNKLIKIPELGLAFEVSTIASYSPGWKSKVSQIVDGEATVIHRLSHYDDEIVSLNNDYDWELDVEGRYFCKDRLTSARQLLSLNPFYLKKYIKTIDQFWYASNGSRLSFAMKAVSYASEAALPVECLPQVVCHEARQSYLWFLKQAFHYSRTGNIELTRINLMGAYDGFRDLQQTFIFEEDGYVGKNFVDAVSVVQALLLFNETHVPQDRKNWQAIQEVAKMVDQIISDTGEPILYHPLLLDYFRHSMAAQASSH